jgi:hypothetical protein
MKTRLLIAALLGLALSACASRVSGPPATGLPADPAVAPLSARLEGVTLTLETSLDRNFMPISPTDGGPLSAHLRVHSTNGRSVPVGLSVATVGVYFQGQLWSSAPEILATPDPSAVEAVTSGGPKWGPGVGADVVVILSLGGEPRALLRSANQTIRRLD